MKLQKVVAYKYGEKTHHKYIITIPENTIKQLDWQEGSELKDSIKGQSLVIDYVSPPVMRENKAEEPKITYEEFRDAIKKALEYSDSGMTWTELRDHLKFGQIVPNNKWVRLMEKDIGLMRLKHPRGIVWRVKHV
jgi:antitoxin component of MazEF toxin-antitoxin module